MTESKNEQHFFVKSILLESMLYPFQKQIKPVQKLFNQKIPSCYRDRMVHIDRKKTLSTTILRF